MIRGNWANMGSTQCNEKALAVNERFFAINQTT